MKNNLKKFLMTIVAASAEELAVKKANSNCAGLMYEPKRPDVLVKKK